MPASHNQLLRELRVAFSAAELERLQTDEAFAKAMAEAESGDAPNRVQSLIELGGALLAAQSRSKSKLRDSRDKR